MLEPSDVESRIQALIAHFDDLNRAHEAVLKAKAQIEQLTPLVSDCAKHAELVQQIESLRACREALRTYFAGLKIELLKNRIRKFETELLRINSRIEQFEEQRKGRSFRIVFKRDEVIDRLSETYADAPEGEKLAHFNSAGYLEISIHKGNAAGLFGLQDFTEQSSNQYLQNRLFYQTIKVYFD